MLCVKYISVKCIFIYILVCINLNMVNAPMHTENLKIPADALHYHSIQYATMCFAGYRQSFIP